MGRDKLFLAVGGEPLLERVARALSACCEEVILAGPGPAPPGVRAVADGRTGQGPLAGMEAGLAESRHPLVFVAAGDMPFVTQRLVDRLLWILEVSGALAVVPEQGGRRHPLCAAYSRGVLPLLRGALDGGTRSATEFVGGLHPVVRVREDEVRELGDPAILLMNVNSPEDLRRARALVGI